MGRDKALLEIEGISLLERSVKLCENLCDHIIISSNNPEHKSLNYPLIADELDNYGPLGGIYSCLKQSLTSWNFVISVDAIFVTPKFVDFLLGEIGDYDAVVPYTNRGKEPLIALYNTSSLAIMKEKINSGDLKMHNLLGTLNTKFVNAESWESEHPKLFHNINRPEDLNH